MNRLGAWRSLVARTVRVGEVAGSNPAAPIVTRACRRPQRSSHQPSKPARLRAAPLNHVAVCQGCPGPCAYEKDAGPPGNEGEKLLDFVDEERLVNFGAGCGEHRRYPMPAPDPYQSHPSLGGSRLKRLRGCPRPRRVRGGRCGIAGDHRARARGLGDLRHGALQIPGRTARRYRPTRRRHQITPRPPFSAWRALASLAWLVAGVAILAAHWTAIVWLVLSVT